MNANSNLMRDLLWVINSPALMRFPDSVEAQVPRLQPSQIDGAHLQAVIGNSQNFRVGKYFESLVHYWLHHIRGCEVTSANHQVVVGGRTVGEIDLIFLDELGLLNHWELTVKFYLKNDSPLTDADSYVGPNARDNLGRKHAHLLNRQLPLSHLHFPEVDIRKAFTRGRIFYHWKTSRPPRDIPQLAPDHQTGQWLRANELPTLLANSHAQYKINQKPFWLANQLRTDDQANNMRSKETLSILQRHFENKETPVLVSVFDAEASLVEETLRYFIVPDSWPESTAAEMYSS